MARAENGLIIMILESVATICIQGGLILSKLPVSKTKLGILLPYSFGNNFLFSVECEIKTGKPLSYT